MATAAELSRKISAIRDTLLQNLDETSEFWQWVKSSKYKGQMAQFDNVLKFALNANNAKESYKQALEQSKEDNGSALELLLKNMAIKAVFELRMKWLEEMHTAFQAEQLKKNVPAPPPPVLKVIGRPLTDPKSAGGAPVAPKGNKGRPLPVPGAQPAGLPKAPSSFGAPPAPPQSEQPPARPSNPGPAQPTAGGRPLPVPGAVKAVGLPKAPSSLGAPPAPPKSEEPPARPSMAGVMTLQQWLEVVNHSYEKIKDDHAASQDNDSASISIEAIEVQFNAAFIETNDQLKQYLEKVAISASYPIIRETAKGILQNYQKDLAAAPATEPPQASGSSSPPAPPSRAQSRRSSVPPPSSAPVPPPRTAPVPPPRTAPVPLPSSASVPPKAFDQHDKAEMQSIDNQVNDVIGNMTKNKAFNDNMLPRVRFIRELSDQILSYISTSNNDKLLKFIAENQSAIRGPEKSDPFAILAQEINAMHNLLGGNVVKNQVKDVCQRIDEASKVIPIDWQALSRRPNVISPMAQRPAAPAPAPEVDNAAYKTFDVNGLYQALRNQISVRNLLKKAKDLTGTKGVKAKKEERNLQVAAIQSLVDDVVNAKTQADSVNAKSALYNKLQEEKYQLKHEKLHSALYDVCDKLLKAMENDPNINDIKNMTRDKPKPGN